MNLSRRKFLGLVPATLFGPQIGCEDGEKVIKEKEGGLKLKNEKLASLRKTILGEPTEKNGLVTYTRGPEQTHGLRVLDFFTKDFHQSFYSLKEYQAMPPKLKHLNEKQNRGIDSYWRRLNESKEGNEKFIRSAELAILEYVNSLDKEKAEASRQFYTDTKTKIDSFNPGQFEDSDDLLKKINSFFLGIITELESNNRLKTLIDVDFLLLFKKLFPYYQAHLFLKFIDFRKEMNKYVSHPYYDHPAWKKYK